MKHNIGYAYWRNIYMQHILENRVSLVGKNVSLNITIISYICMRKRLLQPVHNRIWFANEYEYRRLRWKKCCNFSNILYHECIFVIKHLLPNCNNYFACTAARNYGALHNNGAKYDAFAHGLATVLLLSFQHATSAFGIEETVNFSIRGI